MSLRKTFPLISLLNKSFIDLPSPLNLSVNWNFGSLLGIVLVNQFITGILLSLRFSGHILTAFDSVVSICQDSQYGWLLRLLHSTGASFFFLFLYLHIGRGLYYGSYNKTVLWNIGVILYLLIMGTAFLGYVLPWGQMSYWAATVITNLLSAIPIFGNKLVVWVWGGFAVSNPTLTRFFGLHFLLPFVIAGLVILHIYYLHLYGSANPLGINSNSMKGSFHLYFTIKDSFYFILMLLFFVYFSCAYGYSFMDAENFIPANILVTPSHIQPEWYFLFAYAILRAIPNKLGGVLALVSAVTILFLFSIKTKTAVFVGFNMSLGSRLMFWFLTADFLILTWLGSCVAEAPFIIVSMGSSIFYFSMLFFMLMLQHFSNYIYLK